MLREAAEEREDRLEKGRKAWKKRTAEAKGKQKEYNRSYRQQKEASKTAKERVALRVARGYCMHVFL